MEREIFDQAMDNCENELAKFESENSELVKELTEKNLFKVLLKISFRRGFSKGMKFSWEMLDKLETKMQ